MGKQCQTLFFGAPKSLQMVTAAMKLKGAYSLEGKLQLSVNILGWCSWALVNKNSDNLKLRKPNTTVLITCLMLFQVSYTMFSPQSNDVGTITTPITHPGKQATLFGWKKLWVPREGISLPNFCPSVTTAEIYLNMGHYKMLQCFISVNHHKINIKITHVLILPSRQLRFREVFKT